MKPISIFLLLCLTLTLVPTTVFSAPNTKELAAKTLEYQEFNLKLFRLLFAIVEELIMAQKSDLPSTPEVERAYREVQQGLLMVKILLAAVENSIEKQRELWDIPKEK